MTPVVLVSNIRFVAASTADERHGLLGWASFVLAETLVVESVALRRTLDGRTVISFPTRRDRHGRQHAIVRPVDDAARCALEREVLAALGVKAEEAAS